MIETYQTIRVSTPDTLRPHYAAIFTGTVSPHRETVDSPWLVGCYGSLGITREEKGRERTLSMPFFGRFPEPVAQEGSNAFARMVQGLSGDRAIKIDGQLRELSDEDVQRAVWGRMGALWVMAQEYNRCYDSRQVDHRVALPGRIDLGLSGARALGLSLTQAPISR